MERTTRGSWRLGLLLALPLAQVGPEPWKTLTLTAVPGTEERIFSYDDDRCTDHDHQDHEVCAIRNDNGLIVLYHGNLNEFPLIGPDFDHLTKICNAAWDSEALPYDANRYPDFSDFMCGHWLKPVADPEWGAVVYSLSHHEYRWTRYRFHPGYEFLSEQCGHHGPIELNCHYYALTTHMSFDGGRSFRPRNTTYTPTLVDPFDNENRVVAHLTSAWIDVSSANPGQAGYSQPGQPILIRANSHLPPPLCQPVDYFYATIVALSGQNIDPATNEDTGLRNPLLPLQPSGMSLVRSAATRIPGGACVAGQPCVEYMATVPDGVWRAIDPTLTDFTEDLSLQDSVAGIVLGWKIGGGFAWFDDLEAFLATGTLDQGVEGPGLYYSTSRNGLVWTEPRKVVDNPPGGYWQPGGKGYPSVLDHDSPHNNFNRLRSTSQGLHLYYGSFPDDGQPHNPWRTDSWRMDLRVTLDDRRDERELLPPDARDPDVHRPLHPERKHPDVR